MTAYLACAKKAFLGRSAYRFDHLMGILSTVLQFFIFFEIYRALYGGAEEVDGITLKAVTTNFVLSLGLGTIFSPDDYFLPNRIWDGSISVELLRPVSFRGRMAAENLGNSLFNLIFRFIPVLAVALLTTGMSAPADLPCFLLFLLSALLGAGVMFAVSFAVQVTAFWLVNIWSLVTIKNVFVNVLSGSMIPLWFMPEQIQGVLNFTPFASIYFTPVQIYLGQLSAGETALKCGVQLLWIALIFLVGEILWRKGQRRLTVQGG
jgi:ABC-2 type transport system permease protein